MSPRAVLVQALAGTPADIRRLIKNLDDPALQWQSETGDKSCLDIVRHLLETEWEYGSVLKQVLGQNQPGLIRWSHSHPESRRSLSFQETLNAFESARNDTLNFLGQLSPGDWQRPAQDSENGRITLRILVQEMVHHDIQQTSKLAEILSKWRAYQEA